jgi:hypothetical protein
VPSSVELGPEVFAVSYRLGPVVVTSGDVVPAGPEHKVSTLLSQPVQQIERLDHRSQLFVQRVGGAHVRFRRPGPILPRLHSKRGRRE